MGVVAVSTKPEPGATAPGRARPGEERKVNCRYIRRGAAGQCTAEALDPDADILICMRHAGLVLELIQHHAAQKGAA